MRCGHCGKQIRNGADRFCREDPAVRRGKTERTDARNTAYPAAARKAGAVPDDWAFIGCMLSLVSVLSLTVAFFFPSFLYRIMHVPHNEVLHGIITNLAEVAVALYGGIAAGLASLSGIVLSAVGAARVKTLSGRVFAYTGLVLGCLGIVSVFSAVAAVLTLI